MSNNEFNLDIIGSLQQAQSKKQINADIRQIEKAINTLKITATLAKGDTKREINTYIKELSEKLGYVKLKGKIDEKNVKQEINRSLHNMSFDDIDALKVDENKTKLKLKKVIADVKAYAEKNTISVNVEMKKEKLNNDLTTFLNKNTKIRESSFLLEESEKIRELINSVDDKGTLKDATEAFQLYKSEVSACGFATKSTTDKIKGMLSRVAKIGSLFGLASLAVNNFRKSLSTLKGNDTILTEISKSSEMTKKQLEELGNEAFKVASKYGQLSSSYLLGVQEMSRAGYKNAESMAELSVAAQGAGDMTAELANQYIIATDVAFKMNGSIEALTATLDGANNITNHNAVNMTELAEGMSVVGTQAASSQMEVNEITAAIGTMVAATQKSGREMGNAFKGILMNLQQVSGDVGDGEDIIDAESLTKYEKACAELGVSLKEVRNGVVSLKEPMQILKELAEEYTKLDEADARRANLLSAVGGKYRANALNAILENYDLYEKMLQDYADGIGSMAVEAEKTANSWEGSMNRLQNSFDSFVSVLTNKETILSGISFFDRLIQGASALTNSIGEIPVVLTALNSALVTTNKDYGITQIWNKDKGKIDVQGNIFGIDITNIKNMKKHFAEAEGVIAKWNKELKAGKTDLDAFENSLVQNNAQFKAYLSTCSKDAPASLEGYQAHLKAAGVNTDTLRLKTILLNSAITMLGGWAIQAVITGFYELSQVSETVAEKAKDLGNSFKTTASDIDSYKSKIEDLYKAINDSNSSISDVTEARKNLITIQDELIEKYGAEKETIDIITQAINGQADALDRLTNAKWQEIKNEFNDGGFWNNVDNFFQGKDNIQRMLDGYGEKTVGIRWADFADINELTDEMVAKLENIGIDIKVRTDDLQGIRDFDSLTESISETKGAFLSITGNAEEIYNQTLALQDLIGNDDSFDKLYNKLESVANSYKDLTDTYKDFYNQYILYEKILTEDSKYADTFKNITDAAEKYNEAFTSGDETKIKEAADEYANIVSTAMATAIANGDSDVGTYFQNMYPTLKSIVDSWNFNVAFDANTDDLQGKVKTVLDELKDENGRLLTAEEILELSPENEQYQALISIAHDYNMTLEEVIELLKERNLVSAMDYQGLVGLFGQENVDKLLPEDLEIAYTIKNVGNMTFDQLQAEIQRLKESVDENPTSFNTEDYKDQIDSIQSSITTLRSALESLNKGELSKLSVIDLMQEFPSLAPYIDLTAEGFGNLSEGLSTLIEQQPDSLIQSLNELKDSLTTDEERQQVELLIDSLQRLSSYGDTGIEAYTTTISNTWNDTANVIEGVTTQFENLAKVQEMVADGLTMTATQAAELAKIYPEILTNAELSSNGQITLNEDVVRSILDGDQSIIDAQITKLEADKAELTAKKDFAEAQLEIVKQVGEGEGKLLPSSTVM